MNSDNLLSSLNLLTLGFVLLLAIGAFAYFLRHRQNRALARHAFSDSEASPDSVARRTGGSGRS